MSGPSQSARTLLTLLLVWGLQGGLVRAANGGKDANPVRLTLEPGKVVLSASNTREQLLVTGHFADGSVRDLTHAASFRTDRPDRIRLEGSLIRAAGDGAARVTARAGQCEA